MTLARLLRSERDPASRASIHADDARVAERLPENDVVAQSYDAVLAPVDWAWSLVWLLEWVRRGR